MAEQQLVDYIKKAKAVGQSEQQTRALLYKNGWSVIEVDDAFNALNQPQPQAQPQVQVQPQVQAQPQVQKPQQPVQAQQPIQTQQPNLANSYMAVKRSKTILKFSAIIIILVAIASIALYSLGQFFDIPYNPFAPSPERVVKNMFAKLGKVDFMHSSGRVDINASAYDGSSFGSASIAITGDVDRSDKNNLKSNQTLTIQFSVPQSSLEARIGVDLVVLGDKVYIKASDTSTWQGIDSVKGVWLKLDQDSVKALSEANIQSINLQTQTGYNAEIVNKIQELFAKSDMFSVENNFGNTKIDGKDVYHYLVKIEKEKMKEFLKQAFQIALSQNQNNASEQTQAIAINLVEASINSIADIIGDINTEMWIGKRDYMLYQAKMNRTIDLGLLSENPFPANQIVIDYNLINSNFGKPIVITEPESSQKVEDVLIPIIKMQQIKSIMSQISVVASQIFTTNKSYVALCKNKFVSAPSGAYYSEMFINAIKNIMDHGATNPACFARIQNYCISTQLPSGGYVCIGPLGFGSQRCISSMTICK